MDLKTFIADGWRDHADNARGVADRLADGLALVSDEAQIADLVGLANHVFGSHLGAWREGLAFFDRVAALPALAIDGTSGQTLQRCKASLALAGGVEDMRPGWPVSDRIRVGVMAAASLAEHDAKRATALFGEALEQARSAGLAPTDPANRALAANGNNLAGTLEEKADRSAAERDLMILAAQTARHYWAIAGTWLETERAEYRLAMTWMQAGDLSQARRHARACLEIVGANGNAPLEAFFGWEALGRVERASGNRTGHAQALAMARPAFEQLPDDDKAWCRASLTALEAET
ncbi:MAG TPA: hypothetical protein VJN68_05500 [Burkholderiaceae bacterium]|nr:hypothetical protein [Burkholderiaceae bacterium]